jgi:RluA family pseudouridine synthase
VTAEQQQLPSYVAGKSCPACYREPGQTLAELLALRASQIATVTTPLPGSSPCLNRRPLNVPARCDGMTLIDFVTSVHPQVGRDEWLRRIEVGELVSAQLTRRKRGPRSSRESSHRARTGCESPVGLDLRFEISDFRSPSSGLSATFSPDSGEKGLALNPDRIVRGGEKFDVLTAEDIEPDVNAAIRIIHEDDEFIVLDKPAPLPVHASGRFNRNTLRHIVNLVWFPTRPHIVHRLDANTSGVMVLCKRKRVASVVQKQFEDRRVRKTYLARVIGHPEADHFACEARIGKEPEQGGVRLIDPAGDEAFTEFEVVARHPDQTSLLRVHPQTGRTNQIRAHLWHLGFPIVGDPAYLPNHQLGANRTLLPTEPPMCLHAESLEFRDAAGAVLRFVAAEPGWMPRPAAFV